MTIKQSNSYENSLFPLSPTQTDIYYDQLLHENCPLYNLGGYIILENVDITKLTLAHELLITRHDIFGMRIIMTDDKICQRIATDRNTKLRIIDFSHELEPEKTAQRWMQSLIERSINIDNNELFKINLLKLSDDFFYYTLVMHHLSIDGWGFGNLIQTLGRYY
ncbi:MAG: hypothetical protein KAH18_07440, partial [Psychromonas sp.]|nr:hypothetical protein [Psychromonas sp.]